MVRARLVVVLAAPFGLVAGHLVGYGLGHTDAAERVVAEAGHDYLPSLATAALPLLSVSFLCAVVAGARRVPLRPRVAPVALQLTGVFVGVELVEHLAAGWTLPHLVGEPSLWLGVVTQIVVAAAVVGLLRALVRVGERLAGRPVPSPTHRAPAVAAPVAVLVEAVALTPIRRRGPPAGAVATTN